MTDTVRERLEKAEEVAAKIERKLAYIVGTHCGVATNDLRILLDAYFDQKDLLFECVAYGDPEIESRLAASPQEAAPTKREAALAELAKLDGETMDLAASPQGEGDWITHEEEPALERVAHLLRDHRGAYVTSEYDRGRADEIARLLACRAAPPASIKPSADTGELRERVALEIMNWSFDISRIEGCLELADAILSIIQPEEDKKRVAELLETNTRYLLRARKSEELLQTLIDKSMGHIHTRHLTDAQEHLKDPWA